MSLLREIQNGATDDTVSLAALLRKLKLLASRLGVKEIVEWANRELQGYRDNENLPPYRGPFEARVVGDVAGLGGSVIKNLPFPKNLLPEKYHDSVLFNLYFTQGVAELETLKDMDRPHSPWPADLVAALPILTEGSMMAWDWDSYRWMTVWRIVPPATVVGVLDAIRNRLLDFSMQVVEEEPTTENEQRLSERDQMRVIQVFQTTVNADAANVALGNRDVTQTQELPTPFDTVGLINYFHKLGLSDIKIEELQKALQEDNENQASAQQKGPGRKVLEWLKEVISAGTSKVGVPVATDLITQAILHHFGL